MSLEKIKMLLNLSLFLYIKELKAICFELRKYVRNLHMKMHSNILTFLSTFLFAMYKV